MISSDAPIRVLLVDDSAVVRGALGRIIDAEPDLTVVTTAVNGRAALEALRHTPVDVVLLDIEMPEMDGITALPQILAAHPQTRVIMASSITQSGAEVTVQALALGAADYITKPAARSGAATLQAMQQEIVHKVRAIGRSARNQTGRPYGGGRRDIGSFGAASGAGTAAGLAPRTPSALHAPAPHTPALLACASGRGTPRVLAIASSTGGPNALAEVLGGLPRDFPLPVVITQHMPAVFTQLLAQRLERDTGHVCTEAVDGEPLRPHHVYVAPGGQHLVVRTQEKQPYLQLTMSEPENYCRPSADPMLRSLAAVYGASTLVLVLTGMGEDGLRGCRAVHERGGRILVQDEATSVVWGMPGAVANAGLASAVLPLPDIADAIVSTCGLLVP